ncbi:MAG: hypothetical protein IT426_11015 [Pirellulales bacterium]|nr:hypothetical protein [Pirellulales bacterium]
MYHLDHLTEEQWALLSELIECELNELPVEIRHTRNSEMREGLHRRMKLAQEIFDRIHEPAAV